jgi:hypothetical protein
MRVSGFHRTVRRRATTQLIALGFAGLLSSDAAAQTNTGDDATRAAARQLGELGIDAFRANDFATADDKLDSAFRLFATPTLGLWSGRARLQRGHWVEAAERFREATRISDAVGDNAAQRQAQRDAAKELETLTPRIPSLTIILDGAEASQVTITLDGSVVTSALIGVARPTNPGVHQLTAGRASERYEASVQLAENDHKLTIFKFQATSAKAPAAMPTTATPVAAIPSAIESPPLPAARDAATPEPSSSWVKPLAIAALSLGGVGLVTSGVAALAANAKLDECPPTPSAAHSCKSVSVKSSYDTLRTVSTASFYVGAAFVIGGLVTWFVAPGAQEKKPETIGWAIGPGAVTVRGVF